ncbi:MAG: C39 family peptidase [Bacteroidales bacterium]|nr:C39 family peptidase [Bacteroidales bacterium]
MKNFLLLLLILTAVCFTDCVYADKPDNTGGTAGVRVSRSFDSLVNQIFDANDLIRSVFAYRLNYVSDDVFAGILGNRKLRQTMDLFHKHTGCGITIRAQMGQGGLYATLFTPHKNHGVTSQNPENDFNFNISLIPQNKNSTVCKAIITWSTGFYSEENMQWRYDDTKISASSYETFTLYMKDSVLKDISLPYMESINAYLVKAITVLMGDKANIIDAEIYLSETIACDSSNLSEIWHSAKKGQNIIILGNIRSDSINCILKDNNKNIAEVKDSTFQLSVQPSSGDHHYKITTALITQAQANLAVYNEQEYKVVLMPVGAVSVDVAQVEQALNVIYKPAVIKFNVSVNNSLHDYNKDISVENIAPEEIYNSSMQSVINTLKNKMQMDKKTFYLFLLPEFKNNSKNVSGYMPYKNQFGFVDMAVNGSGDRQSGTSGRLYKTIAHELAHGIFGLEHTDGNVPFGHNLLDYSESTVLCKFQWDIIHDPHAGETDMDNPEQAMLMWRNIVWLTDVFYGFAPDEQESEVENYLPMLQNMELSGGWKSDTASGGSKTYSIFSNMKDKKDFSLSTKAKNVLTEKYFLNGKNYTVKLFPFSSDISLSYKNINIDGFVSLRENSHIRAAYTKDYGLIVFYKNKHPELILHIKGGEDSKNTVKNFLNYLLIVEKNAKQREADEGLSFGWGYLTENIHSRNEVIPIWDSYASKALSQVDLSEKVQWISQFDETIFGLCSGCWENSCCNRACVYMLGLTNTANCNNAQIAKNNPVSVKEHIFIAKFDNDANWETAYDGKNLACSGNVNEVISYIKHEIKEKQRPVVMGVHFTNRGKKPPGNTNKATYHFMVIVGYGADENGEYFRFYDPGRSVYNEHSATSETNLLYLKNGFIRGNYQDKIYTVTQINKYF